MSPYSLLLVFLLSVPHECSLWSFISSFWDPVSVRHYSETGYIFNETIWYGFKNSYKRWYRHESEDRHRRAIFENNLLFILERNAQSNNASFSLGMNKFSDLTREEFSHRMARGWKMPADTSSVPTAVFNDLSEVGIRQKRATFGRSQVVIQMPRIVPKRLDWSQLGAVTLPKDQGNCGNCWAHASAGAIEGVNAISKGRLTEVSVQQLVDCITPPQYQSDGCRGGAVEEALQWTISHPGIASHAAYPMSKDGDSHRCKWAKSVAHISLFARVASERDMEFAIQYGPLVAAVNTGEYALQYYADGIITGGCQKKAEHAVLIVGYDERSWIVKNSWGPDWGERGFFRLRKGSNMCGIASHVIMTLI